MREEEEAHGDETETSGRFVKSGIMVAGSVETSFVELVRLLLRFLSLSDSPPLLPDAPGSLVHRELEVGGGDPMNPPSPSERLTRPPPSADRTDH